MPWARLDDQFPIHRKVAALSDAAFRLHVEAICWCVRNLTDGAVSRADLPQVTRIRLKQAERGAAELVRRGVWREQPDGWQIHDFLDYQPSKDQVQRDRASNTERQRRWRDQRSPNGHAVSNAVTSTVTNSAPARPDPSPISGTAGGVPHPPRPSTGPAPPVDNQEPQRQCPAHVDNPDPPNCGGCADARRRHERWRTQQTEQQRSAPRCRRHRGQPAGNCALCRSEQLARTTEEGPAA